VVSRATRGRSLDRGDRARGRPRPLNGVVLGAQARADVGARGAPRGAPVRSTASCWVRSSAASSRSATWRTFSNESGIDSSLATQARTPDRSRCATARPPDRAATRRRARSADVPRSRPDAVRARPRWLPAMPQMPRRLGRAAAGSRTVDAHRGSRRACVLCGFDTQPGALQFTTWIQARSPSRSAVATRARSSACARRRASACSCARTATLRSRRELPMFP
jgi:hypothetical protein